MASFAGQSAAVVSEFTLTLLTGEDRIWITSHTASLNQLQIVPALALGPIPDLVSATELTLACYNILVGVGAFTGEALEVEGGAGRAADSLDTLDAVEEETLLALALGVEGVVDRVLGADDPDALAIDIPVVVGVAEAQISELIEVLILRADLL